VRPVPVFKLERGVDVPLQMVSEGTDGTMDATGVLYTRICIFLLDEHPFGSGFFAVYFSVNTASLGTTDGLIKPDLVIKPAGADPTTVHPFSGTEELYVGKKPVNCTLV
jgi:hypothetical protein